jgi:hypothetical protein
VGTTIRSTFDFRVAETSGSRTGIGRSRSEGAPRGHDRRGHSRTERPSQAQPGGESRLINQRFVAKNERPRGQGGAPAGRPRPTGADPETTGRRGSRSRGEGGGRRQPEYVVGCRRRLDPGREVDLEAPRLASGCAVLAAIARGLLRRPLTRRWAPVPRTLLPRAHPRSLWPVASRWREYPVSGRIAAITEQAVTESTGSLRRWTISTPGARRTPVVPRSVRAGAERRGDGE